MTLASMTGFARADGARGGVRWHWEIRSVNARGLDLRTRVPSGFERLEPTIRQAAQKRFERGSLTINLSVQREAAAASLRINEAALEVALAASAALGARGVAPPTADGILALKGILEVDDEEPDEDEREALDASVLSTLGEGLDRLMEMRRGEGTRLRPVLEERLERIARLTEEAAASPSRTPDAITARLKAQFEQFTSAVPALDPQRLHQEAMLLATKADIAEELDRLRAHVDGARELLAAKGAVGRRLDFLTQEFNREANTLCSKSNDVALTRIGLELKAVVDQLREQVQNVE